MQMVNVADPMYRDCMRAVLEACDGPDPTSGATHYHTTAIAPYWAEGHTPVVTIGNHAFYVGIK